MKFTKTLSGNYKSEDGKYEIRKYRGIWEVFDIQDKMHEKYIGYYFTLKEAKESI